jgi:enhancer of yellow 2 transcription factor
LAVGRYLFCSHIVDLIRSKGLEKINLDDLVEELLPKGRALVPTKVKEDLLARIKNYLENDSDYKRLTGY